MANPTDISRDFEESITEQLLWRDLKNPDTYDDNKNKLITLYTPFARKIGIHIALRYRSFGVFKDDCCQNALLGLIESIDRFNYGQGRASFKTYAAYRIRGAVLNGLPNYSEDLKLYHYRRNLQQERVESMVKKAFESSADRYDQIIDATLDIAVGVLLEQNNETIQEELSKPYISSSDYLLNQRLLKIATGLPRKERLIVYYHYFLEYRFSEIAELVGVSKARVSQLHAKAITTIRIHYEEPSSTEFVL